MLESQTTTFSSVLLSSLLLANGCAPKTFQEQGETVEEVYARIRRLPGLEEARLYKDENPDAPLVIHLGDKHLSPESEYTRIDQLREELGVKLVGLEGWMGKKQDAKNRKHGISTPCMELEPEKVPGLPVGLEDSEFKSTLQFHSLIYTHLDALPACAAAHDPVFHTPSQDKWDEFGQKLKETTCDIKVSAVWKSARCLGVEKGDGAQLRSLMEEYVFPHYNVDLDDLSVQKGETLASYEARMDEIKAPFEEFGHMDMDLLLGPVLHARSTHAARLITEALADYNQSMAIVVFGDLHSEDFIEEFQARGVHYIHIPPPEGYFVPFNSGGSGLLLE